MADMLGVDRRIKKDNLEYQQLKMGNIPKLAYKFEYEKLIDVGKYADIVKNANVRLKILTGTLQHKEKGQLTGEISNRYNKKRYLFMIDAPFEISSRCCSVMKKAPMKQYHKETGRNAITAQMADESMLRTSQWIRYGCNGFQMKYPISNPMSFWTEQDVLRYIKENNIPICSVYGEIVPDMPDECDGQISIEDLGLMPDNRKLKTTGCNRTGCMFCGFGCHMKDDDRFQRMKTTHPKQYDYIMRPKEKGGLNYKEIIDWINEHGGFNIKY